ncbi:DUF6415 family natural product biosynthesis protein [Streptomyces coerulescens]|uniref:DUF6415 family natural product biosynthesis protein n=1 Tax=Streptomyces coerulescens TaxID=29304 RepID=A0ABW0CZA7_STRCD
MPAATVPAWTLPLPPEALADLLAKVRQWTPFDGEVVLDDVGDVLDDVIPRETELASQCLRFRDHLLRLVQIAVATEAGHKDDQTALLIQQARLASAQPLPTDHVQAVGHLRRMAWSVNELHERLVAIRCLREAA